MTDTETAIAWRQPDAVRGFRDRLWRHALGLDAASWQAPFVDKWVSHAARNAELPADRRVGFVVPMSETICDTYAESSLIIPDELI
jgi:hypothetical protein